MIYADNMYKDIIGYILYIIYSGDKYVHTCNIKCVKRLADCKAMLIAESI